MKGRVLIASAVALLLLLIGTGVALKYGHQATDRVTGCPTDRHDSVTAVLIDLTDPVNPVQAAALRNALLKIRNQVPRYGRLELYPLRPTTTSALVPVFLGCSPGSGRDVDSRLYGNPELADRLWRTQFANRIEAVIAELTRLPAQDSSPVFEGIQSVAVTSFGTPLAERASTKRLVVISDMIHHTSQLSMYQSAPDFLNFRRSPYFARSKPMLRGAQVDVYLVVRDTLRNVQRPPLYKFWVEFFAAGEGYLRHWEPLQ
jgi:hypothetical protein